MGAADDDPVLHGDEVVSRVDSRREALDGRRQRQRQRSPLGGVELLRVAGNGSADIRVQPVVDPLRLMPLAESVEAVERSAHRDQRNQREVRQELELEAGHRIG